MRIMTSQTGSRPRFDSLMGIDKLSLPQIMAFNTDGGAILVEQIFLFSFMGRVAGQTLTGRHGRVLYGTSSVFTVIVTRKTQPVLRDNEQRRHLGSMPDMTGQAFPLSGRGVDTSHLLILPLRMTLHADGFRFLRQHIDKITGMNRMTCRAVSRNERFMKSGTLIRDYMAVAAERIYIFGNDQITSVGNRMTGLTIPADHRLMDNCLQKARATGTVWGVTRRAPAPDAIAGMGLLKPGQFNIMAGLAQIIYQQECRLIRCMGLMTGATAPLKRGMHLCSGKGAAIMAEETKPIRGIDQQTSIIAVMDRMA